MLEMKKRRPFSWTELSRELKRRRVYTGGRNLRGGQLDPPSGR